MNQQHIFRLPQLAVIDVSGDDAATIVHNVTTNEVRSLADGQGSECFVTDVRGKTIGHVGVYRVDKLFRLIGAGGQSERIAQHLDRYTIREDATAAIRDSEYVGVVLSPGLAASLAPSLVESAWLQCVRLSIAGNAVDLYSCRWLGEGSGLLLVEANHQESILQELGKRLEAVVADEASFHTARVAARFPWYGIDLNDTNLPQEADRDAVAISFTKGCYLGQETVARLDALGQVQKKLVAWSIDGGVPKAGTALLSGDKTVGRLTSVASGEDGSVLAIGPARRSHFEPGSVAKGIIEVETIGAKPIEVTATVL